MNEPPFELASPQVEIGAIARAKRRLARVGWGLLAAAGASFVLGAMLDSGASAAFVVGTLLPFAAGVAFIARTGVGRTPTGLGRGRVALADGELVIELSSGARRFRLDRVQQAYLQEPNIVLFELDGGEELAVHVDTREQGQALLAAAGFAASASVLRLPLLSPGDQGSSAGRMLALVAFIVMLPVTFAMSWATVAVVREQFHGPFLPGAIGLCLAFASLCWAILLVSGRHLKRQEVTVGADGITLSGLLRPRFVPFAKVTNVLKYPRGVCLELGDERVLLPVSFLPLPDEASSPDADEEVVRRDALFTRIEQARAAAGTSGVAAGKLALLDRGARSTKAWKVALATLPSQVSGYRQLSLAPDELVRVAEDAGSDPARRVAATVALRAAGDPALLSRVRVAVEACADEDMQRALEQAAEGEILETEIERATAKRGAV